jgi:amidase
VLAKIPGGEAKLHPDCAAAANDAARLLESLGHHVEDSYPDALDEASEMTPHFMVLWSTRTAASLDFWSQRTGKAIEESDVEPLTWALAEMARSWPAPRVAASLAFLQGFTRRLARFWAEGFDLLLSPTLGEPPARLGEFDAKPDDPLWGMKRCRGYVAFTGQFNVSGQPAISLPLHFSAEGLPIGVQLAAAFGREDLLLRVASQLEEARPWRDRRLPIHARRI